MSAQEKFQHMLKALTPILKKYGYTRSGTFFRKRSSDNWGVIGFIKDKWNTRENVIFSIHIGVYSLAIDKQLEWDLNRFKAPNTFHCHWRQWVQGNITTPGYEAWWDVDQYDAVEVLIAAVKTRLLNTALPKIDSLITDEQLKNHWLAGGGCGISELRRLKQLSILLKLSNEREKLEKVLQEMEQKYGGTSVTNKTVATHIQKMREEPLNE